MTNAPFDRIEDYQDIQTVNMYHKRVFEMGRNREEVMASIMAKSRDHARTPMQWDGKNAGFTEGEPWLAVNPNYKTVNAAEAQDDPDSVLNFYKKLIRLRKQYADVIKGDYTPRFLMTRGCLYMKDKQTDKSSSPSATYRKKKPSFIGLMAPNLKAPSFFSATMKMAARNPASHSVLMKQEFICLPDM